MTGFLNDTPSEQREFHERQSATLKTVLLINTVMFGVEFVAGLTAGSVSLVADSLDMLSDALAYGFSLYVVRRGARMKALSALLKGGIMALFGLLVLGQVIYKIATPSTPLFETIGIIGFLALAANGLCALLLAKHRGEDINMRSVWLCSRNDIIANVSVLGAALLVWLTDSAWPDILIGLALSVLFLRSALEVLREASSELGKFDG